MWMFVALMTSFFWVPVLLICSFFVVIPTPPLTHRCTYIKQKCVDIHDYLFLPHVFVHLCLLLLYVHVCRNRSLCTSTDHLLLFCGNPAPTTLAVVCKRTCMYLQMRRIAMHIHEFTLIHMYVE